MPRSTCSWSPFERVAQDASRDFDSEVLGRMAEGESLRSICRDLKDFGCPAASTFCAKVLDDKQFAERYARARQLQCDAWGDRIIAEALNCRMGEKTKVTSEGGVEVTTGDCVDRSRLAVDALKWTLAKLHPKKYGDKVTQEIGGIGGGPILYGWGDEKPKI